MTQRVQLRIAPRPLAEEDVYREYSRYVAVLAFRLLGRDSEIDDLVQDVFLAAVQGLKGLREPGAIKGWLATLTVRLAARRLRRRRLIRFLGLGADGERVDLPAPGASAEQRALLRQVYATLDHLPAAERLAWSLRHLEGEPLESVAALSGCSLATAKRRIAAASAVIERRFDDETR